MNRKRKMFYKLSKIFQISYILTFFISTILIVGMVEGETIKSWVIVIYIISSLLTIIKMKYSNIYNEELKKDE